MNGPIAQLAALTCHGNAFLAGREFARFFPSNSTCQFCDRIEFVETEANASNGPRDIVLAANPDDWIHELPLREVDGLRLIFGPRNDPSITDRMSAGFIGGGHVWTMEVKRDDGFSEYWSPDWRVWNREAAKRRIWRVSYRRERTLPSEPYTGRNLTIVKQAFRESLNEILHFAERNTEGAFARSFEDALTALDNPAADVGFHKDIAVPGQLNADAESLLKAAMGAWVFGGMGSWNDMSFEAPLQTEYENVSERLFDVIHEAVQASITSTFLAS
jgi:hypothetical protein